MSTLTQRGMDENRNTENRIFFFVLILVDMPVLSVAITGVLIRVRDAFAEFLQATLD